MGAASGTLYRLALLCRPPPLPLRPSRNFLSGERKRALEGRRVVGGRPPPSSPLLLRRSFRPVGVRFTYGTGRPFHTPRRSFPYPSAASRVHRSFNAPRARVGARNARLILCVASVPRSSDPDGRALSSYLTGSLISQASENKKKGRGTSVVFAPRGHDGDRHRGVGQVRQGGVGAG